LNPELLAFVLGEKPVVIETVIEKLCQPDPKSRTPDEDGRRLIRLGQFSYKVVNGPKYMAIRNEEERRRTNREAKRRERAGVTKRRPNQSKTQAERVMEKANKNGDEATATRLEEIENGLAPGSLSHET